MKGLIIILTLSIPMLVFSQETDKYQYLSITQYRKQLIIVIGTEKYDVIDIKDEVKGIYDFRVIFKRIEEFETDGWEVFSGRQMYTGGESSIPAMTVMMRRKKQ